MKIKRILRLYLFISFAGLAGSVWATVETTSPVWVATATTLHGNGGSGAKFTTFSKGMVRPVLYAGTISTLQSTTLTDTNGSWTDGQFGTNGTLSYVEFDNGWMADIANSTASSTSLTLAGDISGVVSVGSAYRIRSHFTIASVFGTNNETGLQAGVNPSSADNIILQVPQSQQTLTIFYFTNGASQSWRLANFQPANNLIVYPEQGLMVRRISPGDITLYLDGPVRTGTTVVTVDTGYELLGTLQTTTNLPLSALNLYSGSPATGVVGGLNPTLSDNVLVLQPDGSVTTYFYFTGTPSGWRTASFLPADSTPINAGGAFYVHRLTANGPFDWTMPGE